ncbi:hypothetical protein GWN26_15635 [Candidatus Saccharibacteria bacterium]|nr:hypothetical protein [Candidatus Saccharibacteria bacterium]NIW00471.1 hypothetical protein [Candidatus Saccharibacteria bacterium]NIW80818.1 hypothetical protein [Calditrichia bacterium]
MFLPVFKTCPKCKGSGSVIGTHLDTTDRVNCLECNGAKRVKTEYSVLLGVAAIKLLQGKIEKLG